MDIISLCDVCVCVPDSILSMCPCECTFQLLIITSGWFDGEKTDFVVWKLFAWPLTWEVGSEQN